MSHHEATFEIESKSDAYVVRLLTETLYDTIREELLSAPGDDTDPSEPLQQFAAIREAARTQSPGTLTVRFEQYDEGFDD